MGVETRFQGIKEDCVERIIEKNAREIFQVCTSDNSCAQKVSLLHGN